MTKTTTLTVPASEIATLRKGDRIIAIDGKRKVHTYTVTASLGRVGIGTALGIAMQLPDGRPVNLYPDTHVTESVTIEREEATTRTPTSKKNATHINVGDKIIVENSPFGLRSTRRKTGVLVVQVLAKRKGGYRGYVLTTTEGCVSTPAACVFGIVED